MTDWHLTDWHLTDWHLTDWHRLAAHEAGHAMASFILSRVVERVILHYPPTGGGASIDRMPREPVGHRRRPLDALYEAETDVLVMLAGPAV